MFTLPGMCIVANDFVELLYQRISRIVLRAIHGLHRKGERRPNPVFLSLFAYLVYVRFDQIVTSYPLLPYVLRALIRGDVVAWLVF